MLISGKGKYFSVFGCISKNFPENIFWCLEKKKENTNPRKISSTIAISQSTARVHASAISRSIWDRDLASSIAIWNCDLRRELATARDRAIDREIAIFARSRRLELGLKISSAWSSDWRSAPPGDRLTVRFLLLSRARARSLSLSFFPEMLWSENEGRKSFPGQRWKYWSTESHFLENIIFRDSQTCGKGWKWFPEIIFTQNKRTLSLPPLLGLLPLCWSC